MCARRESCGSLVCDLVTIHFLRLAADRSPLLLPPQVIVALQERAMGKSRPHIPYRNSMMTSILRDSLGGNCRRETEAFFAV